MIYINKLGILGIRSFSPNDMNIINFGKPLTLIAGNNGVGKTTIIECLKISLTGELPPNSHKGQSFVHDPRLNKTKDVKAQVRILIEKTTGEQIVIIRNFIVSLSNDIKTNMLKYSYKATDALINYKDKEGVQKIITSKVNQINANILQFMSINNSILNYVIFCHQDDSLWPIGESTVLKSRFDEIFSSHKYAKIIDLINTTRKVYIKLSNQCNNEIALSKKDMSYYYTNKNKLFGIESKLNELNSYSIKNNDEKNELSAKLTLLKQKLDDLEKQKLYQAYYKNKYEQKFSLIGADNEVKNKLSDEKSIEEYLNNLTATQTKMYELKIEIEKMKEELEQNFQLYHEFLQYSDFKDETMQIENMHEIYSDWLAEYKVSEQKVIYLESSIRTLTSRKNTLEDSVKKLKQDRNMLIFYKQQIDISSQELEKLLAKLDQIGDNITMEELNNRKNSLYTKLSEYESNKNELEKKCIVINSLISKLQKFTTIEQDEEQLQANLKKLKIIKYGKSSSIKDMLSTNIHALSRLQNDSNQSLIKNISNIYTVTVENKEKKDLIMNIIKDCAQFDSMYDNQRIEEIFKLISATTATISNEKVILTKNDISFIIAVSRNQYMRSLTTTFMDQDVLLLDMLVNWVAKIKDEQKIELVKMDENKFGSNSKKPKKKITADDYIDDIELLLNNLELFESIKYNKLQFKDYLIEFYSADNEHADLINGFDNITYNEHIKYLIENQNQMEQKIRTNVTQIELINTELQTIITKEYENKQLVSNKAGIEEQIKTVQERLKSFEEPYLLLSNTSDINNLDAIENELSSLIVDLEGLNIDYKYELEKLEGLNKRYLKIEKVLKYNTDKKYNGSIIETIDALKNKIKSAEEVLEKYSAESDVDKINIYTELFETVKALNEIEFDSEEYDLVKKEYTIQNQKFRNYELHESKAEGLVMSLSQLKDDLIKEIDAIDKNYSDGIVKYSTNLHNKVKLIECLIADLTAYMNSLENAISIYHKQKMSQLNICLRTLWSEIYKGPDIDYISIQSSAETTTKTFDYKVMMHRGDVILPIRGRFSAGQKVLTSFIIRLALAQTFCSKCNIFALDEPTTNLDKKNCESLAYSLSKFVESRRNTKDFQLILITHDQDFINIIQNYCPIDSYIELTKNEEAYSVVKPDN